MFVNRDVELAFLEKHYAGGQPEFIVLFGRRRVGKTELLKRFCAGKKAIFFIGFSGSMGEQISKFQEVTAEATGDPVFKQLKPDWEVIFDRLSKLGERLIVVFDEYPFLALSDKTFSSRMLRIWETILMNSKIYLVLCGSSVNMMLREVLAYKSPLYGRRTGQWKLEPFQFLHLDKFFPDKSWLERVYIYSVVGGIPFYLKYFSQKSFQDVLVEKMFAKGELLYAEGELLLKEELREPAIYNSILAALSNGRTRLSDIVNETGHPKTHVSKYLVVLQYLGLVAREVPVTEKNPSKSKLGLYFISGNYLKFWFKFIHPNASELEFDSNAFTERVMRNEIDTFVGRAFEGICRQVLLRYLSKKGICCEKLGRWWDRHNEIDLVGLDKSNGHIIFTECKWSELSLGECMALISQLKEKAKQVDWHLGKRKESYCIIARKLAGKEKLRKEGIIALELSDFDALISDELPSS